MSSISFDNPWVFYLAIPIAVFIIVPFFIAIKRDNLNMHNVLSCVLHIVMATACIIAGSGLKIETIITKTNVIVVADVSYSAQKNYNTIDSYILGIKDNLPLNSQLGVVCFGKDKMLLTPIGEEFVSVNEHICDDSETNIIPAMQYAVDLLPLSGVRRIVLISDGKDTRDENLRAYVSTITSQGIYVDAIYLDDNLDTEMVEIQINSAIYNSTAYVGKESTVKVWVESNTRTAFTQITLYKKVDGEYEKIASSSYSLGIGSNEIELNLYTEEEGIYDYLIEISDPDDHSDKNNTYTFTQQVSSDVKILAYYATMADYNSLKSLYGDNVDCYKVALNDVDPNIPYMIGDLCKYDEIVICGVDLSYFTYSEMLVKNIETAVSSFGKSLTTYGDLSIQSPYAGTSSLSDLDEMLPVKYGSVVSQPKLFTIVFDISLSMHLADRMTMGREVAKQIVKAIGDDDMLCIMAFSGEVYTMQEPTKLSYCREEALKKLDNFDFRQGTLIGSALDATLNKLKNNLSSFSSGQVMLISDGLSYVNEQNNDPTSPDEAIKRLKAYGIITSVVQVGYGSNSEYQTACTKMKQYANIGGGSYYCIDEEDKVYGVAIKEFVGSQNGGMQAGSFWIGVKKSHDSVLNGVNTKKIYIDGYVLGISRARATTVLTVDYYSPAIEGDNKTVQVPLYAYWNYGNGKVSTYTGKISAIKTHKDNEDGSEKVNSALFNNIVDLSTPKEKVSSPLTIDYEIQGTTLKIVMTPISVNYTTGTKPATIKISEPDGKVNLATEMHYVGTQFTYSFNFSKAGKYNVEIAYNYDGQDYVVTKYIVLPYLPEYNEFEKYDPSTLNVAIGSTGVVSIDGVLKLENNKSDIEKRMLNLAPYLLILSAVIFVIDIGIRRLKWNDIVSFFLGSKYKQRKIN